MKKFSLLILLGVFLFVGCSEEKNDFSFEEKNNEIAAFSVRNGVLHFSSDSSFVETVNEICEMDEEELNDWEATIGFKSLRTELNLVCNQMDLCEDSISFENLIAANSDILQIEGDAIVPIVKSSAYARILNREGIYYVGATPHKVQGGKLAVSISGDMGVIDSALSQHPNSLKSVKTSAMEDVILIDYCHPMNEESGEILKSTNTKTDVLSKTLTHDNRQCKLEIKSISMVAIDVIEKVHYTSEGWDWGWAKFSYSAKTEAKVSNYKKSWGKYRSYATTCEMRNISVTTNFGSSSISHLRSSREVSSLTMIWNVMSQSSHNFAIYGADAVETEIYEAYGQASNRGVGERWVTVSQQ